MTLDYFWIEAVLIVVLILANGFFAASEIAMIAMRKAIDLLLEKGVSSSRGAPKMIPTVFSHRQIGVTVVSSPALGGAAGRPSQPQIAETDSPVGRMRSH
jgi:CBS domain containing-hemolysin-like protein